MEPKKKRGRPKKKKVKVIGTAKPKNKTPENTGKEGPRAFSMGEPKPLRKGERSDWHRNHELILFHSIKYLSKNLRFPSCRILSELTGIHEETVRRHLVDFDQERRKNKYMINLDAVTARMIKDVIETGDKQKAELLYKYVGNWSERLSLEHSGRVDFRTARDKIDESKDNFERTKNFVSYLVLQNDRRKFVGSGSNN